MNQFPKGYQACGFHCGIKKAKDDLTVVVSDVPAAAAAVYTNNLFQAAPLVVTKPRPGGQGAGDRREQRRGQCSHGQAGHR